MRSDNAMTFGFRIVGSCQGERRLVDSAAAFSGYAQCDSRAGVEREAYLSAFAFGDDFAELLTRTGSTRGYTGATWSPWLWFDIDRDEIEAATLDCRRLVAWLVDRYGLAGDELLIFYSGSKGFHVGLPTGLWLPEPSRLFHRFCRRLAEAVAAAVGVAVDVGVYDAVRAFRAPNSRHPKTGRHKRRLTLDELLGLKPARIIELAGSPERFDLPPAPQPNGQAGRDWQQAVGVVEGQLAAAATRRQSGAVPAALNRSTQAFIRDGAEPGDRHRLLFAAAANLAEFGCSFELAFALLSEAALDSGLRPAEVRRQIECGLAHNRGGQP